MNTLLTSIPLSMFFIYGLLKMRSVQVRINRQPGAAGARHSDGNWLARSWLAGIIILMLALSITGI